MKPRRKGVDKARAARRNRRTQLRRDIETKARLWRRMCREYGPDSARAQTAAADGQALLATLSKLDKEQPR